MLCVEWSLGCGSTRWLWACSKIILCARKQPARSTDTQPVQSLRDVLVHAASKLLKFHPGVGYGQSPREKGPIDQYSGPSNDPLILQSLASHRPPPTGLLFYPSLLFDQPPPFLPKPRLHLPVPPVPR